MAQCWDQSRFAVFSRSACLKSFVRWQNYKIMDTFYIKATSVTCSLTGTLLLAVRVKQILSALSLVARVHDKNFEHAESGIVFTRATEHLRRAEKNGVTLLVVGFALLILASGLNGYVLLTDRLSQTVKMKNLSPNTSSSSTTDSAVGSQKSSGSTESLTGRGSTFGR